MLERLIALVLPGRGVPPNTCTRHLPYLKTLEIFLAPAERRSALMNEYLSGWYSASECEPYYDSSDQQFFIGYWSYEAAAITFLLGIDDAGYRDAPFYPKDLVEFANELAATGD